MGTIEEAELLEGRLYRLTMRLEEDDNITFKVGDLVKGIYQLHTDSQHHTCELNPLSMSIWMCSLSTTRIPLPSRTILLLNS